MLFSLIDQIFKKSYLPKQNHRCKKPEKFLSHNNESL